MGGARIKQGNNFKGGDRELTCHHVGGAGFRISSCISINASLWFRGFDSALSNGGSFYPCLDCMDLLLLVPVLVRLVLLLLLWVLGATPRIMALLPAHIADIGTHPANTRVFLAAFCAWRVPVSLSVIPLIIPSLWGILLLALIVVIPVPLALVSSKLPGTLGLIIIILASWSSL